MALFGNTKNSFSKKATLDCTSRLLLHRSLSLTPLLREKANRMVGKKRLVKPVKEAKRRVEALAIRDGQHPDAIKLKEGLKESLGAELGEPACATP